MAYNKLVPFNKFGIYGLETIDATVSNDTLTYVFESHPYVNTPYNGLLLIHFTKPAPSTASATMPIYFETRGTLGSRKAVKKVGDTPLTAGDISVPCYALFFYDFRTGIVEAVAGITPNQD